MHPTIKVDPVRADDGVMTAPGAHGQGSAAIAAGWYTDPSDPANWRWWDGFAWTDHVSAIVATRDQARAHVAPEPSSSVLLWPVPAIDAPLFERDDYSKHRSVSFRAATRAAFRRRWPRLVLATLAEVLGALVSTGCHVGRAVFSGSLYDFSLGHWGDDDMGRLGQGAVAEALFAIRCDARDAPWAKVHRDRGLHDANEITLEWHAFSGLPSLRARSLTAPRWYGTDLLAGMPGACGEYVSVRRDDNGSSQSVSFHLFAAFRIPPRAAQRHPQVAVRPKGLLQGATFSGAKVAQFESTAVARTLRVEVSASVDPLTVRELFGPQLLAQLADYPVSWDQRGDTLLVFQDSPAEPGLVFDEFVQSATAVARAYWADQV
ncbi:MAG: hypothetical protein JWO69_1043 [Thermoleophilia bacterium]|jgi:hypothetical protein|nr:hypothetical protein [Thermoleophilia bacterium]